MPDESGKERARRGSLKRAAHPLRAIAGRGSVRAVRAPAIPATLFDDLFLETLDKRDHITLFGLWHLELRQGRCGMTEEHARSR